MGRQFDLLLLVTFTSTFYAKDPETLRIQQKQLKERFETVSKLSNYPQLIYSKSLQSEVQSANLFMLKGAITLKPPIIFRTISIKYNLRQMTHPPKL